MLQRRSPGEQSTRAHHLALAARTQARPCAPPCSRLCRLGAPVTQAPPGSPLASLAPGPGWSPAQGVEAATQLQPVAPSPSARRALAAAAGAEPCDQPTQAPAQPAATGSTRLMSDSVDGSEDSAGGAVDSHARRKRGWLSSPLGALGAMMKRKSPLPPKRGDQLGSPAAAAISSGGFDGAAAPAGGAAAAPSASAWNAAQLQPHRESPPRPWLAAKPGDGDDQALPATQVVFEEALLENALGAVQQAGGLQAGGDAMEVNAGAGREAVDAAALLGAPAVLEPPSALGEGAELQRALGSVEAAAAAEEELLTLTPPATVPPSAQGAGSQVRARASRLPCNRALGSRRAATDTRHTLLPPQMRQQQVPPTPADTAEAAHLAAQIALAVPAAAALADVEELEAEMAAAEAALAAATAEAEAAAEAARVQPQPAPLHGFAPATQVDIPFCFPTSSPLEGEPAWGVPPPPRGCPADQQRLLEELSGPGEGPRAGATNNSKQEWWRRQGAACWVPLTFPPGPTACR